MIIYYARYLRVYAKKRKSLANFAKITTFLTKSTKDMSHSTEEPKRKRRKDTTLFYGTLIKKRPKKVFC